MVRAICGLWCCIKVLTMPPEAAVPWKVIVSLSKSHMDCREMAYPPLGPQECGLCELLHRGEPEGGAAVTGRHSSHTLQRALPFNTPSIMLKGPYFTHSIPFGPGEMHLQSFLATSGESEVHVPILTVICDDCRTLFGRPDVSFHFGSKLLHLPGGRMVRRAWQRSAGMHNRFFELCNPCASRFYHHDKQVLILRTVCCISAAAAGLRPSAQRRACAVYLIRYMPFTLARVTHRHLRQCSCHVKFYSPDKASLYAW